METPGTREEAAAALAAAAAEGLRVRARGGGTKLAWGGAAAEPDVELSTARLDRVVEHNQGDLTAVIEAGVPLAAAQERFAKAGQMLALDPPLGAGDGATVGGVVATGDSGPLRHRYGAVRDLLLGITVALSDGTVARAGGKVIKNVAGYDLAKLFAGSFGTLGLVLDVSVRLHPLPVQRATAAGVTDDPSALARAAAALTGAPLELESLDVCFADGRGELLARAAGAAAEPRAEAVAGAMAQAGLSARLDGNDEALWERQRAGQRSAEATVVRVSATAGELERVVRAAERAGAAMVGRAALGISWLALPGGDASGAVQKLREDLAPSPCVVLDAPPGVREAIDPWGEIDPALVRLMTSVKRRFDPAGACNPGVQAGGI